LKIHTTLSIDSEVFTEAKQVINYRGISREFEDFLRLKLNQLKGNSDGISLVLKLKELEKVERKYSETSIILQNLRSEIQLMKEKSEKKEQKRLESEKKLVDSKKKCVFCNTFVLPESKTEIAFVFDGREFFIHTRCVLDWMQDRQCLKLSTSNDDLLAWWKQKEGYA